jgi:hypothetical protein
MVLFSLPRWVMKPRNLSEKQGFHETGARLVEGVSPVKGFDGPYPHEIIAKNRMFIS